LTIYGHVSSAPRTFLRFAAERDVRMSGVTAPGCLRFAGARLRTGRLDDEAMTAMMRAGVEVNKRDLGRMTGQSSLQKTRHLKTRMIEELND
jgi:hypothetical protein